MRAVDLTGQKFGRLLVLMVGESRKGKRRWHCRCDCGTESIVLGGNLRNGHTQSCGCAIRESSARSMRKMNTTHGHTGARGFRTPTYGSWRAMRYRCISPSDSSYAEYGAKGVTVCERWSSFENFLADMGERPEGMTLDRIDNAKGYGPDNCRWATRLVQQNNRSCTTFIEYNGRRQSIGAWCAETGLSFGVLNLRLKMGWSAERALTEPARKKPRQTRP